MEPLNKGNVTSLHIASSTKKDAQNTSVAYKLFQGYLFACMFSCLTFMQCLVLKFSNSS